jgi:hypothetical protein
MWNHHIARMKPEPIPKQLMGSTPGGTRFSGPPPPKIMLVVSAYATKQKRPKRPSLDASDDDGHYNFVSQKYRNRV